MVMVGNIRGEGKGLEKLTWCDCMVSWRIYALGLLEGYIYVLFFSEVALRIR